jgi:hypothetical protein
MKVICCSLNFDIFMVFLAFACRKNYEKILTLNGPVHWKQVKAGARLKSRATRASSSNLGLDAERFDVVRRHVDAGVLSRHLDTGLGNSARQQGQRRQLKCTSLQSPFADAATYSAGCSPGRRRSIADRRIPA